MKLGKLVVVSMQAGDSEREKMNGHLKVSSFEKIESLQFPTTFDCMMKRRPNMGENFAHE